MVEAAGDHWEQSPRLFVERPVAGVKIDELPSQRRCRGFKQGISNGVGTGEPEVVNPPDRPDKAVKDMSGRKHYIFFAPPVVLLISKGDSPRFNVDQKGCKSLAGRFHINTVARFAKCPN